jgi:hypothetical protein
MNDKYTMNDIPMILNSISWQLKRIADVLESDKEPVDNHSVSESRLRVREMIKNLNPRND